MPDAPSDFRFDDSDRPRLRVRGEAASRFLQGFCTADVTALSPGETTEAFFPSVKGRVLGYGVITREGEGFEIALFAESSEPLQLHLAKYAVLDPVEVTSFTAERSLVSGPTEKGVVRSHWPFAGLSEVDGAGDASTSAEVWEGLRVASGLPVVGPDLSDKNIVQEAGRTQFAVSFKKGCYLGQEPIARLDAMGHTNKELRVLKFAAEAPIQPGDAVFFDGQAAGQVTSTAVWEGQTVALAMLKTVANAEGTQVHAGGIDAVVELPTA